MKPITTICAGVIALGVLCAQKAMADRNSDFWAPENMAKNMCASVHLTYGPEIPGHTAAYTEAVIEKSAPGTYFACNNFTAGYIGVQQLPKVDKKGNPVRVAIFSVWDAKDTGDNPHAAPEEERAKLIQRGPGVRTDRFGGEGTGGKSMRLFPWKEGQVIRTLVVEKPDGDDFRQLAGYIYDPDAGKWMLLSCWRIQALRRGLGGGCGFVEDFLRNGESKAHERRATFGPALRWDGEKWHQASRFRFTKDRNPNNTVNCRLNPSRGYFSLATGGDIKPGDDFKLFESRDLVPLPEVKAPEKEVMEIIHAPLMQPVHYQDQGKLEQ